MSKTPYQNEFQDTPLRTPAQAKAEVKRRAARAKAFRERNENAKRK